MASFENPFSTRHIRPGALNFRFPPGSSLDSICSTFQQNDYRGQIVGPHGTGKSTLLCAIVQQLQQQGIDVLQAVFRAEQTAHNATTWQQILRWVKHSNNNGDCDSGDNRSVRRVVAVDGIEQLGWWNRRMLCRSTFTCQVGLIVTSHRSIGLPTLWSTRTTPDLAIELTRELCSSDKVSFSDLEITQLWQKHRGNIRETLFELYDWFEERDQGIRANEREQ